MDSAWQDACEQFELDHGPTPSTRISQTKMNNLVALGFRTPGVLRNPDEDIDPES